MTPLKPPRGHLPLKLSLSIIMLSVFFVVGAFWIGKFYYDRSVFERNHDDRYKIVAIMQTCNQPEQLKTVYLAELMELSFDKPSNLYAFSSRTAREKLLGSPLIKEAAVKKIRPGTIYVDYQVRKPVAFLADFTNTALDEEGVAIPFHPFFTPKNLPEIVSGITKADTVQWGKPSSNERLSTALSVLAFISGHPCKGRCHLKRVDVSKIDVAGYGQQQLVVILEDRIEKRNGRDTILCIYPRVLRLTVNDYRKELGNYFVLQQYLLKTAKIPDDHKGSILRGPTTLIDLRIPQLAFITELKFIMED